MWWDYNNWDDTNEDRREENARALRKAREDRAAAERKAKEEAERKAKEEEEKRQAEKLKQEEERKRREAQEEFVKDNFHWERPYASKDKQGPEQLAFNLDEEMN